MLQNSVMETHFSDSEESCVTVPAELDSDGFQGAEYGAVTFAEQLREIEE